MCQCWRQRSRSSTAGSPTPNGSHSTRLATLHPESLHATNTLAQIALTWGWSDRDDDLLDALDGFATDNRSQRTLIELSGIVARARRGERDPRFDRFAADDFESLPWNQLRLCALATAGSIAAAPARPGGGGGARGDPRVLPRTAADPAGQLHCVRRRRRPTGRAVDVAWSPRRGRCLPRGGCRVVRAGAGRAPLDPDCTPARPGTRVPRRPRRPRRCSRPRRRRVRRVPPRSAST